MHRAAVRRKEHIQSSIIKNVSVRRRPSHARRSKFCSNGFRNLRKFSFAQIPEKMRRLRVSHIHLNFLNVRINVAIRHQDIRPAVEVVVEKETSKPKRKQGSAAHFAAWRFIHKQAFAYDL